MAAEGGSRRRERERERMRPILLKGHERPLTYLKFNAEGDLLFSCAKDNHPTLWYAGDGERIGTYKGHNGTVWTCDVTSDSEKLLTASGTSRERKPFLVIVSEYVCVTPLLICFFEWW